LCPVLGLNRPEAARHAEELGMAMQLTNILRDVDEDLRRGRRYLPLEELQRFGVGLEDVEGRRVTPEWERFMEFQIERARGYYRSSEKGICCLEPDGSQLTVWLMRHVYAGILDGIERRRYDVFRGRVSVSLPRKLTLAVRAWRDSRRTRDMTGC
jgi:phytoene synthase